MDSFEPIRAAAEHLHHQVADGATPKKPMELVSAAIKHLKLELTWLSTGDPALKGARAVFDDQLRREPRLERDRRNIRKVGIAPLVSEGRAAALSTRRRIRIWEVAAAV